MDEDFGQFLKRLHQEKKPDPVELFYALKELEKLGIAINSKNSTFSENDVNLVFESEGITNELLIDIIDKFLKHLNNKLKKNIAGE